jgi:hypothetical protein
LFSINDAELAFENYQLSFLRHFPAPSWNDLHNGILHVSFVEPSNDEKHGDF